MIDSFRGKIGRAFPRVARYGAHDREVWFAGTHPRAMGYARTILDDDVQELGAQRIWRGKLSNAFQEAAADGVVTLARGLDSLFPPDALQHAVEVPSVVRQDVSASEQAIASRSKSVRDDLRRIRKANFTYRIETSEELLRTFYEQFYVPHMTSRHDVDALTDSFETILAGMANGGEMLCVDYEGEWIGGSVNGVRGDQYEMKWAGLRDANPKWFDLRTTPAMYKRSIERAAELGLSTVGFGKSLPFLGKGLVRFKSKWLATVSRDPFVRATCRTWIDLRHAHNRAFLEREPMVIVEGDGISVVRWMGSDEKSPDHIRRDVTRFPGITRWYILSDGARLKSALETFASQPAILGIPVSGESDSPLWLGDVLAPVKGI